MKEPPIGVTAPGSSYNISWRLEAQEIADYYPGKKETHGGSRGWPGLSPRSPGERLPGASVGLCPGHPFRTPLDLGLSPGVWFFLAGVIPGRLSSAQFDHLKREVATGRF